MMKLLKLPTLIAVLALLLTSGCSDSSSVSADGGPDTNVTGDSSVSDTSSSDTNTLQDGGGGGDSAPPCTSNQSFGPGGNWNLPSEFTGQFGSTADQASCSSAPDVLHILTSIDGDQRPDLIVTNGCDVDTAIGDTHWRVFANTGSAFGAGSNWALPSEFTGQFGSTADQSSCSSAPDILHTLTVLDGDQRPDLVVTNGCDVDTTIGDTHWRIFPNTGSGFGAGSNWTLPSEFTGQFGSIADQSSCSSAPDILHLLVDLNGDQQPDLVVTNGCDVDTAIGDTHWRVFLNTGSGFGAGSNWALPSEFTGQFGSSADQSSCSSAPDILHLLVDINGDRRPDLVVTNGCDVDTAIGDTHWRVFLNTGTGFGPGSNWTLPSEFTGQFGSTADQSSCSSAPDILHLLTNIDGDGLPDIVVTNGCDVDTAIGDAHWRVFPNTGSGFGAGSNWTLPAEFTGQFGSSGDQSSCSSAPDILHQLTFLDGSQLPGLAVTNGCDVDTAIGDSHWRWFPQACQ